MIPPSVDELKNSPSTIASMNDSVSSSSCSGATAMKPAPMFSRAVDSRLNPVMRSTTRTTRSSSATSRFSRSVPWTVRVSVGLSRYSGC